MRLLPALPAPATRVGITDFKAAAGLGLISPTEIVQVFVVGWVERSETHAGCHLSR